MNQRQKSKDGPPNKFNVDRGTTLQRFIDLINTDKWGFLNTPTPFKGTVNVILSAFSLKEGHN